MNIIKTSDWHLTDGKDDRYKWDFFPWLREQIIKYEVDRLDFLGDLTEKKDRHSSDLLNGAADELVELSKLCQVVFLKGNHDYIDADNPFFRFLNHTLNIQFVTHPTTIDDELFLPHARDPEDEWGWSKLSKRLDRCHTINLHQTLIGSKVPNGHTLDKGISHKLFKDFDGDIYSGDIHMPQDVKGVTYIGSPYPVYFGDNFQGRVILIEDDEESDLEYPCLQKHSLKISCPDDLEEIDFKAGDQAKITLELHPSETHLWPEYRKDIKEYMGELSVQLFGLGMVFQKVSTRVRRRRNSVPSVKTEAPEKTIKRFVEKEGLSTRHLKVAEGLMNIDVGI